MSRMGFFIGGKLDYMISELRLLYQQNAVLSFCIEKHPNDNEWLVSFTMRGDVNIRSYLLDTRRKQVKHFKTIDAAKNAVEEVGFTVTKLKSC